MNLWRNPSSKRDGSEDVAALGGMYFLQCVQSVRRECTLKSRESGPQSSVHIRHLPADQATHKHILRVANGSGKREDFVALSMTPPATTDRRTRDPFGEVRHGAVCALENDAMATNEGERGCSGHVDGKRAA